MTTAAIVAAAVNALWIGVNVAALMLLLINAHRGGRP
jgi:hypothetical protein